MNVCRTCGQQFFPASPAWGHETCGVCIAAQLQGSLQQTHPLPARVRRPVKRASDLPGAGETVAHAQPVKKDAA